MAGLFRRPPEPQQRPRRITAEGLPEVAPGLIDNSGVLFGPQINQTVVAALIASTLSVFTPAATQAVNPSLIASNTQAFQPTVNRGAGPDFVQHWTNSNSGSQTSITVTLSPSPTAGNLLVAAVASDKTAGTYTVPTGFELIREDINTSVSGAIAWKIADGTETSVQWQQSTASPQGLSAWVGEYSGVSSLDVSAETPNDETVVTSRSTGTTGTTSSTPELAVAMMAADTGTSVDLTRAWSNSFAERSWTVGGVAGCPGLSIADKFLGGTQTVETTFTTTDTGDQMYAAVATFSGTLNVRPGLINQSGVTFSPTINQQVTPGFINQSGVTFDPSVRSSVSIGVIDNSGVLFTPQVNQSVRAELIASTVSLFTPQANQSVQIPFDQEYFDNLTVVHPPRVHQSSALGLINQSGVLFSPTIVADQFVDPGLIDQSGVLFGPSVNQSVQFPLIVGGNLGDLFVRQVGTPANDGETIGVRTRRATSGLAYFFTFFKTGGDVKATIWREDVDLDDTVIVAQANLGPVTYQQEWAVEAEIWGEPNAVLTRLVVYPTASPTNKTVLDGPAHNYPTIVRTDTTSQTGIGSISVERLHTFPLAKVNQSVALGLINQSGVTFSPTVNQSVTPGLISQLGTTFQPQVNQSVQVPLIGSTVSTFQPTITQQVRIPLIDQSAVIFAPIVQFADVQNVFPDLINQSGVTFGPTIRTSASLGLIDQSAVTFQPQINQQVSVGLIGSTANIFTPTVTQQVRVPLIDQSGVLFQPTLNQQVRIGLIDNSGVTFSPNVQRSVNVGLISNLGVTFTPTVRQQVQPDQVPTNTTVFAPTVLRKDPQSVDIPRIESQTQVFELRIKEKGRKKGGTHVIDISRPTQVIEASFEFRWNVLAGVESALLIAHQVYGYVGSMSEMTWRAGAIITDDRNVEWSVLDLDPVTKTNRMILAMEIDPDLWLFRKKKE